MKYETIEDIYAGNAKAREKLKNLVAKISPEDASHLADNEKWSIQQIVEHISIVDESSIRICTKLLKKAEEAGQTSDGSAVITDGFIQKGVEIATIKLEAPDVVRPSGEQTIEQSLAKLEENTARLDEMRPLFESIGGTDLKFPHPFFGDLSAQEWLALKGGHERRHIKQIERLLEKMK